MKPENRDRALVFFIALSVRAVIGWIFFGSVDLTNALLNAGLLLQGAPPSSIPVPYFPGIHQLLIWTSAALAIATPLPLAFAYKLFPLVFDAAIAVLVYDSFSADGIRARRNAFLYALAPVPIIVTVIHTQWDAMAVALLLLSFLLAGGPTRGSGALAGTAFVLSLLIKPIAVPFLPLLFPTPWRKSERRQAASILTGIILTAGAYVGVMHAAGDPVTFTTIRGILYYANYGSQIFGFSVITGGHVNRLLGLAPLLLLVPLYWQGRVTRDEAAMLTLAFLIASSGIGPQYLLWIVPFLLVSRRVEYAAIYSFIAGVFLIVYYHHPGPAGPENLGALAPLRPLAWLAPSATFLEQKMALLTMLGSVALPLSALLFFLLEVFRLLRNRERREEVPRRSIPQLLAPAAIGFAVVALAVVLVTWLPEPTPGRFNETIRRKTAQYTMYRYEGTDLRNASEPSWVIPAYTRPAEHRESWIDATTIGYAWVVVWSVAVWKSRGVVAG
jgi:hypothetical protein